MAASTLALGSAGSAVSAPVRDCSKHSSRSAFGTSLVQFAPVRRSLGSANKVVVVRANLQSEDEPASGKKFLASFVAAGAALSIAGQALAGNPVDFAKTKADEVVSSAQSAASSTSLPNLPKIELPNAGALQDVGKSVEGAVKDVQGRMDGIFAKNTPYRQGRVASTNGGTGSAIGDAKKRISKFPAKNPFAENLTKTTEEFNASIPEATGENSGSARAAREFLGKDSTRVDAATEKVKKLGDNLKNKAGDALDEAKGLVGSVQNSTPDLPSIQTPQLPSLPNPLEGANKKMQDVKGKIGSVNGDLTSSASKIKGDVASKASNAIGGKANNAVEGVKNLVGSAPDVKSNVASKVDDVKGGVSSKVSSINSSSTPGDVVDGAKNLVGSAQDAAKDATSNFPSVPNPFLGLQGKADDVKGTVASKVDDVKGDADSKLSNVSTPVADDAQNLVGSAQDAASTASRKVPSVLNIFGGFGKKVQGTAADVKENVASTVDNVKGSASNISNSTSGDAVDSAKTAAQDVTSNFPTLPNPLEGFGQNVQGNASNVKDNVTSKVEDVKGDLASKASSSFDSSKPGDIADGAKNLVGRQKASSSFDSSKPGDIADGAKNLVGSAQDATSNLPNLPNPFEGLKNLTGKASDAIDNGPNAGNLEDGLKAKASLK